MVWLILVFASPSFRLPFWLLWLPWLSLASGVLFPSSFFVLSVLHSDGSARETKKLPTSRRVSRFRAPEREPLTDRTPSPEERFAREPPPKGCKLVGLGKRGLHFFNGVPLIRVAPNASSAHGSFDVGPGKGTPKKTKPHGGWGGVGGEGAQISHK